MSHTIQRVRDSASELESWKSSYALPVDTQERIQKLLDEAAVDMDNLDHDIVEARKHLEALKQRRKSDMDRIAMLRLAISSVKNLLPEILEQIFNDFNDGGIVTLPPSKHGNFTPWILGHICASWRCILWNSPSIWTRIAAKRSFGNILNSHSNLIVRETMNYILSNTSTTISLSADGIESEAIFDIILSHSKRFKGLTLYSTRSHMLHALLELPPYSLSSLEVLDIDWGDGRNPESSSTTSSLQTASNLRIVAFSSYGTTHIPQILLLPWAQLADLHITCMELTANTIYTTLQECPGLISTHLSINSRTAIPARSPLILNLLRKLSFTASHTRLLDWNCFLRPFVTPALTSLSLSSQQIPIPTISSFLLRSGCSLQELSISTQYHDTNDEGLGSLLELLPNIIKIRIPWMIPAPIIRNIFREPNGILPFLTYGSWTVDPSGLAATLVMVGTYMSHAKQHRHRPLYLSIGCYEGPGFKDVEDAYLKSYSAYKLFEGLDISVYNASASRAISRD